MGRLVPSSGRTRPDDVREVSRDEKMHARVASPRQTPAPGTIGRKSAAPPNLRTVGFVRHEGLTAVNGVKYNRA